METNVIVCKWKKTQAGYRLWVKGKRHVFGEAASFEDAEQALIEAIWHCAPDRDAVETPMPVYDPPLPPSAVVEEFMKPELYVLSGDTNFSLDWRCSSPGPGEPYTRDEYLSSLFSGGICATCKHGRGKRTDVKMVVDRVWSWVDVGDVRVEGIGVRLSCSLFSERFLSLLCSDELRRFEFRPVEVREQPCRQRYYELLPADLPVSLVSVKEFDARGWECRECGRRVFSVDEPTLEQGEVAIGRLVCSADLPVPLPSCFPVGLGDDVSICLTRKRWDKIRGHRRARGAMGSTLGVVPEEDAERHPRLCHYPFRCDLCAEWPEPTDVANRKRKVFDVSARDSSMRNLQWLAPSEEEGLIQVTRKTLSFGEMDAMIDSGRGRDYPEFISFRCPECWRLGRVILRKRELSFAW